MKMYRMCDQAFRIDKIFPKKEVACGKLLMMKIKLVKEWNYVKRQFECESYAIRIAYKPFLSRADAAE